MMTDDKAARMERELAGLSVLGWQRVFGVRVYRDEMRAMLAARREAERLRERLNRVRTIYHAGIMKMESCSVIYIDDLLAIKKELFDE